MQYIAFVALGALAALSASAEDCKFSKDLAANVEPRPAKRIVVSAGARELIEQVGGGVHIRNDSSGDIEITDVQRDVTIDSDSSGSISVERVGGNFTVSSDGSGGISHNQVTGTVRIPDED
jgi:hypothetical protein